MRPDFEVLPSTLIKIGSCAFLARLSAESVLCMFCVMETKREIGTDLPRGSCPFAFQQDLVNYSIYLDRLVYLVTFL